MKRFLKIFKKTLIVLSCLLLLLAVITYIYMLQPKFGALPEGNRLALVKKSPNYRDGKFRNLVEKPVITEGYSMWGEGWKTIFDKVERSEPVDVLPSIKTDLKALPPDTNVLVWFGHSSFFMQLDGVKILVDPVFSGYASPLPGSVKAYNGSDIYSATDMPDIDYMLISHDHYDHLDYETSLALRKKVKYVVCGLGVGAHYERWGYTASQIVEKDWYEKLEVKPGFNIFTESTHHDCARGFKSSQALWVAFYIQSPSLNVYYSGDGGYSDRFTSIAQKYPRVDWAIMECGQYNKAWQSVHKLPEEVVRATVELNAKNLLPVHHSKFTLARHPWDEPLSEMEKLAIGQPYKLATPMIGEKILLNDSTQVFKQWWKNVK